MNLPALHIGALVSLGLFFFVLGDALFAGLQVRTGWAVAGVIFGALWYGAVTYVIRLALARVWLPVILTAGVLAVAVGTLVATTAERGAWFIPYVVSFGSMALMPMLLGLLLIARVGRVLFHREVGVTLRKDA